MRPTKKSRNRLSIVQFCNSKYNKVMRLPFLPKHIPTITLGFSLLPIAIAYAQFSNTSAEAFLKEIVDKLLRPFANLLLVAATVVFLFGVVEYIAGASNETARTTGRDHIMWGTIGLAIMISVRLILEVLMSFFYPHGA
jgi:FtsH-binding integral membrane protein